MKKGLDYRASIMAEKMFNLFVDKREAFSEIDSEITTFKNYKMHIANILNETYVYFTKNEKVISLSSYSFFVDKEEVRHIYPVYQYTIHSERGMGIQYEAFRFIRGAYDYHNQKTFLMSCYDYDNKFWIKVLHMNDAKPLGYKNAFGQEMLTTGGYSKRIRQMVKDRIKNIDY